MGMNMDRKFNIYGNPGANSYTGCWTARNEVTYVLLLSLAMQL